MNVAIQCPELRATVTEAGEITMTPWSPHLGTNTGPVTGHLTPHGVIGVFDLRIDRAQADGITIATDLLVSDVLPVNGIERGRQRMADFAKHLGYSRVWLEHEPVAIEPELLGGTWQTACRHCGITWADSSDPFWLHTRGAGFYPLSCNMCSHPLVQPTEEETTVRPGASSSVAFTPGCEVAR